MSSWDYGNRGLYFITICTKNREHYFGGINNGHVNLSEIGEIVTSEWIKTFDMRPDMNLEMGEYVVMPNHFHAIIGIGENRYNADDGSDAMHRGDDRRDAMHRRYAMHRRDAMHCVSTGNNKFGPQSKNLASVIRGFKIGVTTNARKINPKFAWQPRFHDHIVRNVKSFENIQRYIINNPLQWKTDKFHNSP